MTTAIIGTGNIGSRLAADLVEGGEPVLLAGREIASAQLLAASLGENATAVTIDDAFTRADVIIFAVWLDTTKTLLTRHADSLAGKILVDPSNPIEPDGNGGFVKNIAVGDSAGLILSGLLPTGSRLVKAFGTLAAETLTSASRRTPELAVGFYAADDDFAGATVARLIAAAGFDPIKIGGIDQSIRIEVFGDLHEFGALGKAVNRAEALAAL
ncbi:NADPH-dependent F420 reductase [Rhodococcus tibetensis]|uniref:NAD(P)-binding domain-containing protein n=1 Tax=Rhodococcus tibetensis TaxID=2965064 RepID=A0ABT1QJ68_9NOCA|nr:NAD(P)-binding domain-containing protein [Rhodococcus sp. FXJ9.536]MCQ4122324.1 NAD(P)-binding domain-containing protein [Rhodococcus sp. FXJ9.536]